MTPWYYLYSGLSVFSEIELPEWEQFLSPTSIKDCDVQIITKISTDSFVDAPRQSVSQDEYFLQLPHIGLFQVTKGKQIVVTHPLEVEQQKLRLFLLGSVWSALCYQRGLLAVHAGAVVIGNEAILLCAAPGKGKSTLTAFLAKKGHPLVSDDLCCLDITKHIPVVHPAAQRLRLWSDALETLGWEYQNFERDFYRHDKFLVPWSRNVLLQPVTIRAIYLLEWGSLNLARLTGLNALKKFIAAGTYRGDILQQMEGTGAYWQRCLKLIESVPVWELTRPKNLAELEKVSNLLEQQSTP